MAENSRRARQERLRATIDETPLLTDEELAERFGVSVQTIRLDRMALGIPEVRERMRAVAATHYEEVRSLTLEEVFGEIVDLDLGVSGLSVWKAGPEHAFLRSSIIRGHHIFAQANSLAVAIVDAEQALTAKATVRYLRSANAGSNLVAKARVIGERLGYVRVKVHTRVNGQVIFEGDFLIQRSATNA